MRKKTFLVTGGSGFIGSNICQLLIKKNFKVKIYDNNYRGSFNKIKKIKKKVKFIKGDIRDQKLLISASKNTDAIIHLAYINGTKYFYTKPVLILDIAIKGILNVMEACIKNNIKELYLASSSEVYQMPTKFPTDEKETLKIPNIYNPRYSYGGGKILTELMGIHYGKKYFKKLIIFRPHNVYGPNMGNEHVIPEFINRMKNITKKKKNFLIRGNGNESRSFMYIEDFVRAFNLLISKGKHLNIYNIGDSKEVKIKNLAEKVAKILKKKIKIYKTKIHEGSAKKRCPNIAKIRNLGFKAETKLDEGLAKTIKWYY